MQNKRVVLFQSDLSDKSNSYLDLLKNSNIDATNIPPLSFKYINCDKLKNCLLKIDEYDGIIFSSTRAVNAVASVLCSKSLIDCWRGKHNFSVGPATSEAAETILNLQTVGADSGNSEKLCQLIIKDTYQRPLLFPCSNIRKNTIPDILQEHGISIQEIVCYETVPNEEFQKTWKKLLEDKGLPDVLVFFSPSGVQFCSQIVIDSYLHDVRPKVVAIGPSTEKALLEANILVSKVAKKPNPESILFAINDLLGR